jgi:hypothetical protein
MTPPGPLKGRPCSVCTHPQAREIATALLAGGTCRDVGRRYGIAPSTLARHNRLHLNVRIARAEAASGPPKPTPDVVPASLQAEAAAAPRVQALETFEAHLDVMRAMRELHQRTLALLDKAEASNDLHVALRAVREARGNLELLGRLDGSLDAPIAPTAGPVNIVVTYVDKAVMLPSAAPRLLEDGEE